jgi:hypothetical protein
MSTLPAAMRQALRLEIAALFLTVALAGCGDKALPVAPSITPPATTQSVDLSFTVYDSAKGRIGSFKRTLQLESSLVRVTLGTSDFGSGIDPDRFAIRYAHQGDQLGPLVAASRSGTLDLVMSTAVRDFDVFVMNASSGADYKCADNGDAAWLPGKALGGARYGTLRLASAGEVFRGSQNTSYVVQNGTEDDLMAAVDQVNAVLNPFGLSFARMDYVGRVSTASISAGWSADLPPTLWGLAQPATVAPWIAVTSSLDRSGNHSAYHMWIHELIHAWQNAPDYYKQAGCGGSGLDCVLWDCPGDHVRSVIPLSPRGRDIVRYWTLMSM